jgi:zinc transport system substrate-binding protein
VFLKKIVFIFYYFVYNNNANANANYLLLEIRRYKLKKIIIKLLPIWIISIMILTACGQNGNMNRQSVNAIESGKGMTIVTSFYPMYIFAENIVKGITGVTLENMTQPQQGCLHDYSLTPKDLKTLEKAQVFIINGAGIESFMDKVIQQYPSMKIIEASKGIELIKDDKTGAVNPHVWVSVSSAISEVKNIGTQLAKIDKANAAKYKSNTENYVKKLENLRDKMHKSLDGITRKNIITFHEAFPYFAKEFNLNIVAIVEREPGSEPSAGELADIIKTVKASKVNAIFTEPQYSPKVAETIATETGVKIYALDPVVTGSSNPDPEAYIRTMEQNLKTLEEALK